MITVWHAPLAHTASLEALADFTLSSDERALGDRIHLDLDRRRFRARRALLRQVLARELGCAPVSLELASAQHGKPFIARPATDLVFSLSHAADRVVIAIGRARRLGVDLERIDAGLDHRRLVSHLFSGAERSRLAALPADQRTPAFFRAWTCKEAVVKAIGAGLFETRLELLEVTIDPDQPAATSAPGLWLADLDIGPGFRAALASDGPRVELAMRAWSEAG
jgi:4'-phosphopantetheinyl transferase